MKLTFEKKTTDLSSESRHHTTIQNIKEELGRQNKIDSEFIDFFPEPNQTLQIKTSEGDLNVNFWLSFHM